MKQRHTRSVALILEGKSLEGGGGAERRFIRLWRYFLGKETSVHLILNDSLFRSGVVVGLFTNEDIHNKTLHIIKYNHLMLVSLSMFRIILQNRFDIIHLVLAQKRLLLFYLMLFLQKKHVITHTIAFSAFSCRLKLPLATIFLSQWIWKNVDRIDSLYSGFLEAYAKPLGFYDKVEISPCSFSEMKFCAIKQKKTLIVFSGRLIEEKNPILFVEALSLLRKKYTQWEAIIAGEGPLENSIKIKLRQDNMNSYVKIQAFADMSQVFSESLIFVSLQKTENYPSQSLLEAMLACNVVVATNVGETSKIVQDGSTGFLIEGNPRELSEKLFQLLSNPILVQKIALNGKKFVEKNHTIERFAEYINGFWLTAYKNKRF